MTWKPSSRSLAPKCLFRTATRSCQPTPHSKPRIQVYNQVTWAPAFTSPPFLLVVQYKWWIYQAQAKFFKKTDNQETPTTNKANELAERNENHGGGRAHMHPCLLLHRLTSRCFGAQESACLVCTPATPLAILRTNAVALG